MKTITYWTTTSILAAGMLSGGIAELIRQPQTVAGMEHLGYPAYFVSILGFWKVLATIVLLVPGFALVKEWAYAGIFFNMTGAAVSHMVVGDAAWHIGVTLGFALLAVASWTLRPAKSRLIKDFRSEFSFGSFRAPAAEDPATWTSFFGSRV